MSDLPSGWAAAPLWDLGESIKGSVQPAAANTFELYSVPSFADAEPEVVRGSEIGSHKRPVLPGDLLICKINPRINRVWLVGVKSEHDQLASPEWLVLRTPSPELTRLLVYQLSAPGFRQWIERGVHGVTGSHTRAKDGHVLDFVARIPPREEQERIVAAIEEAFSKLDAGEAGLRNVRQLLKRMRDAVLAAAVTGRLVPQDPTDTPATKLLADLDVEVAEADGRTDLPDGWAWAILGQAVGQGSITDGPFGSNLKTEHYTETGPRVVRLQNIGEGAFRDEKAHISEEHFERLRKHEVVAGDVLVASLGEVLPRACSAPAWLGPAIVKADCIRIRPGGALLGSFLELLLNSSPTRSRVSSLIKGVGRPRLNLGGIRTLPVPVPPLNEQARIVGEVDRQMSFIDACERSVDAGLEKSAALRRSVLRAAFEGRLVPQDPTDEPASVLLERIRAEREAAPKPKKRRKKATA